MARKLADTFDKLLIPQTGHDTWRIVTEGLADIGLDQINYAFLDFSTFGRMEARGDPAMSTMRRDWLEYYTEHRYDLDDEVVAHVRSGRFNPKLYRLSRPEDFSRRDIAEEAREAGLQAGFLVPLPGPWGDLLPAAGIVMGSSLGEEEVARIVAAHAGDLVALAYLQHTSLSGELLRRRAGVASLSPRERDCLQLIASGARVAQIADRLMLADATVNLYLRNARRKLGARTPAEAVAKAMLYQQIEPG